MASISKRVRKRLEAIADSKQVTGAATRMIARHIRRLYDRTEWTFHGRDEMQAEVTQGQPVIVVLWHGRLTMAPKGWDPSWGPFCVVTSAARPGRMVGRIMQKFGLETLPMRDRKSNTGASLQVARMYRQGVSMGFAIDGPVGPAHTANTVAIDWARLTGAPIWLYTNSVERYRTLNAWDRLAVPKPGGRGCMLYRRWDAKIPKRMDNGTREALRRKLETDLDALSSEADMMMGHDTPIN